jgi:Domain of unknown function (DUF4259)
MGTWSPEPFGNDTACDWSYELLDGTDLAAIETALDAVLGTFDAYLDADQACEAIAAVEVLAKLLGRGTQTDSYTEGVDQWVSDNPQRPTPELLQKARRSIGRVRAKDSELLYLWQEGSEADAWTVELEKLLLAISV